MEGEGVGMNEDILAFISYAFNRHCRDGHNADFELCQRRTCKRARQLEIYLVLSDQWIEAAMGWLAIGGKG